MKVRDIAHKVGDIEIKAPQKNTVNKFFVFLSIIYKLANVGGILFGLFLLVIGNEHGKATGLITLGCIIGFNVLFFYIVKSYKDQTSEL